MDHRHYDCVSLMILPLTRPLIALDVETDGIGTPERSRIVELGFEVHYHDDRPSLSYVSLINPERPISLDATKTHGIRDEDMLRCARCGGSKEAHPLTGCEVFKRVPTFAMLSDRLAKNFVDCDFCGYNVRFDLRVMSGEFARVGVPWSVGNSNMLDPLHLWRVVAKRTLSDAVREFLEREPTAAHRALGDAQDALAVALAMLERYDQLPRDVGKLHDLCFDADNVDPDGKFKWVDKDVTINFGKHKGKTLQTIARVDRWYFEKFMLGGDFTPDVKKIVADALLGVFPVKL